MSDPASGIILHNYPQSPVAEKVRVAFGIKKLHWRNVEIPRLPPKPLLTTLTGGYRRTPVMQIGADFYCDSQCILRELEARFPGPSFFPQGDEGLQWCMSRWLDGALFDLSVKIVLGSAGENLPEDFARDRGRLYLGENWTEALAAANHQLPHLVAQMRAPLTWVESQLKDGRNFLTGAAPALIDAQLFHNIWFIEGRWDGGAALLAEFPSVDQWRLRVQALGHGTSEDLSPESAIAIAQSAQPFREPHVDKQEPQMLEVGTAVTVNPDVDGGEQPVEGAVRFADAETIAIDRVSDDADTVCVHFPRAGYRIQLI